MNARADVKRLSGLLNLLSDFLEDARGRINELQSMEDIVRKLAESDPVLQAAGYYDQTWFTCSLCGDRDEFRKPDHRSDCLWLQAKDAVES